MGRYSGNGMGPAFRVYWPLARSGAAMQRDLDRRHRRDPETVAAADKLQRLARLDRRLNNFVQKAMAGGAHPLDILRDLAAEIRRVERCAAALRASKV